MWLQDIEYRKAFGAESVKIEVAAALADARKIAGMTQSMLAERAGVSQEYIAKLERGDANPTVGNIGRMFACMWLNLSFSIAPMKPLTSFESVFVESQGASDFEVAYFPDPLASSINSSVGQPGQAEWTLNSA